METIYTDGTPIASYLEGQGAFDPEQEVHTEGTSLGDEHASASFAPPNTLPSLNTRRRILPPLNIAPKPAQALQNIHDTWSTAINSRLGHAENAKFLEHFRYILVASQLLNEYVDQGAFQSSEIQSAGQQQESGLVQAAISPAGVAVVAGTALALAGLLRWTHRSDRVDWARVALVLVTLVVLGTLGYLYWRRQWLRAQRNRAVAAATKLTTSWQAFEVTTQSAISLIQEVELVSGGYRISTPLPPASRIEQTNAVRRCARLRKALHKAYNEVLPACISAITLLHPHVNEEDLDRYYEIYDINPQDIQEATNLDASDLADNDAESLVALRMLSFRAGIVRRVVLCHLMSLNANGGKPDTERWIRATYAMTTGSEALVTSTGKISQVQQEMETLTVPMTPAHKTTHAPTRAKMRSQVHKLTTLSTGIRSLQAKMQILREESNRAIEQSDDLTDLGPDLMTQYDSIGADLKELMAAWELGKASLQSNITKQERRISMASSGVRSPVSSLGGLTAVDEDGSPAEALRALNGEHGMLRMDLKSHRSSMATTSSEDEVFEAIGLPKQRSSLTREERIVKMCEERDRQAALRAKRDANTSMLKELESVINLRPKQVMPGQRVTSM